MMADPRISEGLRNFLKEKIQTVLRLEILHLLHQHQPRTFTAFEVANQLGFESDTTAHELGQLQAIGVVVQPNRDKTKYRYEPLSETLRSLIDLLAQHYSKHRVPILSVLLADHLDRTRLFAEAFRIIRSND
jgi:hypothetical protein